MELPEASKPFVEMAEAVAKLVFEGDWATLERERLVDRKSYISYYEQRHKITVEERGSREYLDGMRRNFDDKHKVMADPALAVTRVEPGKEGDFPSAEVWATFRTADPEKPGSIVLQLIRIKGKWRVTSLE